MEGNNALIGLQATESLHHQYQELLRLLGQGNMLLDKSSGADPSSVPEKCENTNKLLEEVLKSMKSSLKVIHESYQSCSEVRALHDGKMLKLEDLLTLNGSGGRGAQSPEYEALYRQLQDKNADLKVVIDEVRQVFGLINQLSAF